MNDSVSDEVLADEDPEAEESIDDIEDSDPLVYRQEKMGFGCYVSTVDYDRLDQQ